METRENKTVYTIGYSGFAISNFIEIIKANSISVIIDVRSQPYSRYFPEYNKEMLEKTLKHNSIGYQSYAKELGGKQSNPHYYSTEGYFDFELYTKSENFIAGLKKLKEIMAQGHSCSLMCAEKNPINCHRGIMIAPVFYKEGYEIIHLMPNNMTITQKDIEKQLLEIYFPRQEQLTLFDNGQNQDSFISLAYKKRNQDMLKSSINKKTDV